MVALLKFFHTEVFGQGISRANSIRSSAHPLIRSGLVLALVLSLLAASCGSNKAGQDALAEEVLKATSSLVQDVELVVESDGDSEALAVALEKLAATIGLLAASLEASADQEPSEETELAAAIREAVPDLVAALDRLSYMTFANATYQCRAAELLKRVPRQDSYDCARNLDDPALINIYRSAISAFEK